MRTARLLSPRCAAPGLRECRRGAGGVPKLRALAKRVSDSYQAPPSGLNDPLAQSQSDSVSIIHKYTTGGFIVNGVLLSGAVMVMPRHSLLFGVYHVRDLTPHSLEVLRVLETTDLLILGTGPRLVRPPPSVSEWTAKHGFAMEVLSTPHACSTFNFMVQEKRSVAGILFPVGHTDE
ncbi:hypothetical protein AB1Y20_000455 [Prymnesium parvum]|uniref:NADH dehydrogenase [ubiquinone] 1 alpha subcomplex assembly factor 3 n=1 Tax=Prymnesium parvum TaxID=97485 RepID=A0AB34KAG7_PRYPA